MLIKSHTEVTRNFKNEKVIDMLASQSFYQLSPHDVLNCIEEAGFSPTGEFQQLNSYENRVFDVHLEVDDRKVDKPSHPATEPPSRIVTKFYRPGRWSQEALLEEHQFLADLKNEGITAIAPLKLSNGSTLMTFEDMFFCIFPRFSGRMPQEFLSGELKQVGRTLARIHNIGSQSEAQHRPFMHPEEYGWDDLEQITPLIDPAVRQRYDEAAVRILEFLEDELDEDHFIRLHGDCHKGNLLHDGASEFFFVDFDDFLNGPVAQDFWMLLSDSDEERDELISGYEELRAFPHDQLRLFEPLRGLRIIHYAAWITKRWSDPSFPRLFPDFNSYHYWVEEAETLEKIAWKL